MFSLIDMNLYPSVHVDVLLTSIFLFRLHMVSERYHIKVWPDMMIS